VPKALCSVLEGLSIKPGILQEEFTFPGDFSIMETVYNRDRRMKL